MNWNTRWFLDLNELSRHTVWAHWIASAYVLILGPVVLTALVVAGWVLARRQSPKQVAAAISAGVAALVAYTLNQPLSALINEPRPYQSLHHVLVLVPRILGSSMPSDHAVMAGAVIAGLLLYSWRLGSLAALAGLALVFDQLYVGRNQPTDVLVGLVLGAAVALLFYRVVGGPLRTALTLVSRTPLRRLVLESAARPANPAPPAGTFPGH